MKNLFAAFVLGSMALLLLNGSARADIYVIQPGQLKYAFQESHREIQATYCSIKKSGADYQVAVSDRADYQTGTWNPCNAYVEIDGTLALNQFTWPLQEGADVNSDVKAGRLSAKDYQSALTAAGSIADNFKVNTTPPMTQNDLYDLQVGTVFTKDGSCFSKQLRLEADPQSKIVSNLWLEDIAAKCP